MLSTSLLALLSLTFILLVFALVRVQILSQRLKTQKQDHSNFSDKVTSHLSEHLNEAFEEKLTHSLRELSQTQAHQSSFYQQQSHQQILELRELRDNLNLSLAQLQAHMGDKVDHFSSHTQTLLSHLNQHLNQQESQQQHTQQTLEHLQTKIHKLDQTLAHSKKRGSFGEIQLQQIIRSLFPQDHFSFEQTLSNGMRVDCLISFPQSPGTISIDAKFPLDRYLKWRNATQEHEAKEAYKAFLQEIKRLLRLLQNKYIITGETADFALLFLPSDAIFQDLFEQDQDLFNFCLEYQVFLCAPSTLATLLLSLRALIGDHRASQKASALRQSAQRINSHSYEIQKTLLLCSQRLGKLSEDFSKLQKLSLLLKEEAQAMDLFTDLASGSMHSDTPSNAPREAS